MNLECAGFVATFIIVYAGGSTSEFLLAQRYERRLLKMHKLTINCFDAKLQNHWISEAEWYWEAHCRRLRSTFLRSQSQGLIELPKS